MDIKHFFTVTTLVSAFALSALVEGANYPPNIDYGQKGDFIAKRASNNGRSSVIMPIGPVVVLQPQIEGASQTGVEDTFKMINRYFDISDLTNPQSVDILDCALSDQHVCINSQPVQSHGTLIRFDDNEARLYEPMGTSGWTVFDPNTGATTAGQMGKSAINESVAASNSGLSSPHSITNYWSYLSPPEGDYKINSTNQVYTQWDHLGQTGVTGFPFTLGNLLVYASDQQQTGLAIYDMTGYKQGQKPILLSHLNPSINKPEPNNGIAERLGGYWVDTYGTDRMVFAARRVTNPIRREKPALFIVNFEDPVNPYVSCEIFFDQNPDSDLDGDLTSSPMYPFFQDEYAYVDHFQVNIPGCETAYANDQLVDETEFQNIVHTFNDTANFCDGSQYFRPLGQVGIFGGTDLASTRKIIEYSGPLLPEKYYLEPNRNTANVREGGTITTHYASTGSGFHLASWPEDEIFVGDVITVDGIERTIESVTQDERVNEQGICFMVIHDEPDTRAPYISGHTPKADSSGVPIDTFIHIHIPETLRSESLIGAFQVTNDTTGEVVASTKQLSHTGLVSLWPEENLDTFTSYTVNISGVQDFMGNTIEDYSYQFTTGGDIVVTLPPIDDTEAAPTFGSVDFAGTPYYANQSSQLSCRPETESHNLWAVNPDNHSVTVIDTALDNSSQLNLESQKDLFAAYQTPTSITDIGDYQAVTFRDDDRIVFFDANTQHPVLSVNTGYGTQPVAAITDENNHHLYVALYGSGELLQLNLANLSERSIAESARITLGPKPKAMAMVGHRLLVTRYISARDYGEVYDVDVSSMSLTNTIRVNKVTVEDSLDNGSGVPNFLSSIVLSADGNTAYVTAIKANTDNTSPDDDNTVRPMVAMIDLVAVQDVNEGDTANPNKTIDFDNHGDPTGITYLVDGVTRVTSMQANNVVIVENEARGTFAKFNTGGAPQHMCATDRILYVKNFTTRDVSAIDLSAHMYNGRVTADTLTIDTVAPEMELLSDSELNGLQIFYHSSIPEMGGEGYMSCASCHADGGEDGRVWNMNKLGEGLRNTLSLNGTSGTRFGNLHWSQNFDEVQDFEIQMEQLNGGTGLLAFTFGENDDPLSVLTSLEPDTDDLNDLATYISSLGKATVKRSPYRHQQTGELTAMAIAGQSKFTSYGCASCHTGKAFRDGLAHDVGTIDPNDNQAYGQEAGFIEVRTPTLIELWLSAPYLHNGSAETLTDVFDRGGVHSVNNEDRAEMMEYLYSIDRESFIEDGAPFPENE